MNGAKRETKEKHVTKLINRKAKDTVFEDFFSRTENLFALYKALYPEDKEAKEEDLELVSIRNILTQGIYNDLGFIVKDRLIVLVEAQSTWTVNIVLRSLFYAVETLFQYFDERDESIYGSRPLKTPKLNMYVLYTGQDAEEKEDILSFKDIFGESDIDARVRVLKHGKGNDIKDQYIDFCKILDEEVKKHKDDKLRAVEETIRKCVERDIMRDYMTSCGKEVRGIMVSFFDQDRVTEIMKKEIRAKALEEGTERGIALGEARGEKRGAARGEKKGKLEGLASAVRNLMKNQNCAAEEAMRILGVAPSQRNDISALLA